MGGLRDLINKYTSIAKGLPEQRQKLALMTNMLKGTSRAKDVNLCTCSYGNSG
jgi:hypothetical protein